jgi:hypothetical protein
MMENAIWLLLLGVSVLVYIAMILGRLVSAMNRQALAIEEGFAELSPIAEILHDVKYEISQSRESGRGRYSLDDIYKEISKGVLKIGRVESSLDLILNRDVAKSIIGDLGYDNPENLHKDLRIIDTEISGLRQDVQGFENLIYKIRFGDE